MIDFILLVAFPILLGFFIGYFYSKYKNSHSELCDNVNIIKENVENLQVQFCNYMNK